MNKLNRSDYSIRLLKSLIALQSMGVREVPTPHYSPVAMMVRRRLFKQKNPVFLRLWVDDDAFIRHEFHSLDNVISWQRNCYVCNLISIGSLSGYEIERLFVSDPTPRMVVFGSVKLLCDGNHRFWWLRHLGVKELPFLTVHVTDREILKADSGERCE